MFGIFADLLSSVISVLLPIFASYKALRSANPAELAPWLMYWVVLSGILLVESWTLFVIGWFPFYSWIRLYFLAYLVLPQTQGARFLYLRYAEPLLHEHEQKIENLIGRTHEQAKTLGLQYVYQAIDLIREKILGLQPLQQAPPPPSGPAAYAQNLFSRFNLPVTPSSNLSSPALDALSRLTSAVTSVTYTGKSREIQADEISASGVLNHEGIASLSPSERARIFSSYRQRLEVLTSVIAREERKLDVDDDDEDANDDLAYGTGLEGLRKNVSDVSFDRIEHDDARSASGLRERSSPTPTPEPSGGWTGGWFGSGTPKNISPSGADFAARAVDEIARASGFDSTVSGPRKR